MNNKKQFKIILVVGARPNFMKAAPIFQELKKHKRFQPILVHTGQHYDRDMSDVFFRDLGMPKPDIHLGVGSGTHSEQTAKVMIEFEKILVREDPDLVIVVGDVNSTIACSLATAKYRCTRKRDKRVKPERLNRPLIAHVEAGLRSYDRTMPEEINRLLTDQISDYLFTTCRDADRNLIREGIPKSRIFFVGNVMIDTLKRLRAKCIGHRVYKNYNLNKRQYALVTLHRPSNVDNKSILSGIMSALQKIAKKVPVIFPVHPRTLKQIHKYKMFEENIIPLTAGGFERRIVGRFRQSVTSNDTEQRNRNAFRNPQQKGIFLTKPLGYLEFMGLMANAALVLTDSGGIQEETTILGVPCLTLRNNTERPITITEGTNILVGTDPKRIIKAANHILSAHRAEGIGQRDKPKRQERLNRPKRPELWDGKAAGRIVKILKMVALRRDRII